MGKSLHYREEKMGCFYGRDCALIAQVSALKFGEGKSLQHVSGGF